MDHRHFPNSYRVETDRGRGRNRAMTDHSYTQRGRAAIPNNGPAIHQNNNAPRGGYYGTTHWNSESRNYNLSSSMQVPHVQPSYPGPSYNPYPQSSQNNSTVSFPNHNHGSHINHNPHAPQNYAPRGNGSLKRKGPETSVNEVSSSSRRFYGSGSTSRSSEFSQRKLGPHVDYGHRNGSSFAGEGSSRNVRRRPALDLEANSMPTNASYHSSHHNHLPNNPPNYYREPDPRNLNGVGSSQNWNFGATARSDHRGVQTAGASSSSHRNNHGNYRSDSISSMDVASSSQYAHGPVQAARGRRYNHHSREIPSYSNGPSYYPMRNEPAFADDRVHTHNHSSYGNSSQSARGWGNSYSSRTSGIVIERFQSIANDVDTYRRMRPEDVMMDLPIFYAPSHNMLDQYREMRLDIDDMSYEELLALGESIGNVNIGLTGDVISLSLTEETYSSMQNNIEESCSICLEEYVNEVAIGTVMNCGHSYHADCIKKWLSMKNLCPICKAPAHKAGAYED